MKKLIIALLLILISIPVGATPKNVIIGKLSAPIELKLYYSMTCPACGRFHANDLVKIKEEFVDTGIAKLEYIPYPLDHLSFGIEAFLACIPNKDDHYNAMSDLLSKQREWLIKDNIEGINTILSLYMTQDEITNCENNTESLQALIKKIDVYKQKKIVRGTPSMFVNGKPVNGLTYQNVKAMINQMQ